MKKNDSTSTHCESRIHQLVQEIFPRSALQLNAINESDAEIVKIGDQYFGINIDEYSAAEDFFSEFDPSLLGYNLVMASCSDMIATGSRPQFYLHSMILAKSYPEKFTEKLLKGIAEGLKDYQAFLLGGDTSTADNWHYIAVVLGETKSKIKRSGAKSGQLIYSTGPFGAGNRQALVQMMLKEKKLELNEENILLASPRFPMHLKLLPILEKYGRFAMDTSDGLINTIHTLHQINPTVAFEIDLRKKLVDQQSTLLSNFTHIPEEVFLFSTLGEYELVFGVDSNEQLAFEFDCQQAGLTPLLIGEVKDGEGIHLVTQTKRFKLADDRPDPRSLSPDQYLKELMAFVMRYFHG